MAGAGRPGAAASTTISLMTGRRPVTARAIAPSSSPQAGFGPELDATVKWFNPDKGFGFVALADGSGDVFLHANALTNAGHGSVSPGASLRVRVGQGQKGRQVMEVLAVDEGAGYQEFNRPSAGAALAVPPWQWSRSGSRGREARHSQMV